MSIDDKQAPAGPVVFSGTHFLDELEKKHNHVLDELDALNARIERVLSLYAESRQAAECTLVADQSSAVGPSLPMAATSLGISQKAATPSDQPTRKAA